MGWLTLISELPFYLWTVKIGPHKPLLFLGNHRYIEINTLVVFLRYPYLGASNISEAKLLLFIGVTKRIRYPIDKYQP